MADRTSAEIFGNVFTYLAKQKPSQERDDFALAMWKSSHGYDFSTYQMYVDEALTKLGLAKHGVDPEYPDDGETIFYAESDGKFRT